MPKPSSLDKATQCVINLIELLQTPAPASPFPQFGDEKLNAIWKLAKLLQSGLPSTTQPNPYTAPPVTPAQLPRVTPTPRVNPSQSPRLPPMQL